MEYEKLYPFWEHLTESEKEYIENSCYKKIYEKGMLVHREEENCMGLVSVLNGQLRTYGPMSRLWTQKVELFSPYLIARRDVSYAARASSSTCCGVL